MSVKVSKEFRWEMGHRLPYHDTCRNLHGHSYRMVVEVEGAVDDTGMILDFGELSTLVKPIVERLDHSFMVDPSDESLSRFLCENGLKTTLVPFYSTAENIADWIVGQLEVSLFAREHITGVSVSVFETVHSCASASRRKGVEPKLSCKAE